MFCGGLAGGLCGRGSYCAFTPQGWVSAKYLPVLYLVWGGGGGRGAVDVFIYYNYGFIYRYTKCLRK